MTLSIMAREHTYTVILQPEPEGGFTVFAPSLPGLVTYGADEAEAMAMAREAVELYVAEREATGEALPTEFAPLRACTIHVSV